MRVSAGLCFQGEKIWIFKRGPGRKNAHLWEFPGGKEESGETPADCLVRELREELSLEVSPPQIVREADCEGIHFTFLRCEALNAPRCTEHEDCTLAEPRELLQYAFCPADTPVARALALHGVAVRKDGTKVNVVIGEDENDPVFCISDLLIHLAQEQMAKNAKDVVEGEALNLIVGGRPLAGEEKEPVKAMLLSILKEKYDLEEEDMLSAEIEVVPADKCRDFGLDRSMLLGYGHDDRVCSFASLEAILRLPAVPKHTCCCLLADKEEIGSVGATGMRAHYFENAMAELLALTSEQYSDLMLRRALAACRMLSCDVSAGYDPLYASCFEKKNAAYLGRGVCYNKYTGSRGKSGSNDANAEFLGHLRKIMDDNHVAWQTAELGKVDVGGGGTIAYICALYGMEVVDSGVPVLSMHAPLEIISKADLYEAVKAYHAFMQEA